MKKFNIYFLLPAILRDLSLLNYFHGWYICVYIPCTFRRQNQGWIPMSRHAKFQFNFLAESPCCCVRQINGERFGRQLFWMLAIKIAGWPPIISETIICETIILDNNLGDKILDNNL